ncbi:unnamed protein product [Dicrocoelium dendriticum]|nr:unnamed protein product [Dicrocoelium dendriticum]
MSQAERKDEEGDISSTADITEPSVCEIESMAPLSTSDTRYQQTPKMMPSSDSDSVIEEFTQSPHATFQLGLPEILLTPDKTESHVDDKPDHSPVEEFLNSRASYNSLLHWRHNIPKDKVEYLMNKYSELQGTIFSVDIPLRRKAPHAGTNKTQTLGLLLAGNSDRDQMSVFVCGLRPGSLIDRDGRIEVGDQLLEVDGHNLYGLSHINAAPIIRAVYLEKLHSSARSFGNSLTESIRFVVQRYDGNWEMMAVHLPIPMELNSPLSSRRSSTDTVLSTLSTPIKIPMNGQTRRSFELMPNMRYEEKNRTLVQETLTIRLIKGPSGFGFSVMESNQANGKGIHVKQIVEGGPAAKDGQLCPGDRLIRINGKDVTNASYDLVLEWIRSAKYELRLQISRWSFEPHPTSPNGSVSSGVKRMSAPQLYSLSGSTTATHDWESVYQPPTGKQMDLSNTRRFPLQTVTEYGDTKVISPARITLISRRASSPVLPSDKAKLSYFPSLRTSPRTHSLIPSCALASSSRGSVYRSYDISFADLCQPADIRPIAPGTETEIQLRVVDSIGLGIGFIGGSETSLNYIAVHEIYANGCAVRDGRLRPGDRILRVNSSNLVGVAFNEAVKRIHTAYSQAIPGPLHIEDEENLSSSGVTDRPNFRLTVLRPNQPAATWYDQELVVELTKKAGRGLGLCIADRCVYLAKTQSDSNNQIERHSNEITPSYGVIIIDLIRGSLAATDGRLLVNDQILSVNNEDTSEYTSEAVGALIKKAANKVTIKVGRLKNQVPMNIFYEKLTL